MLEVERFDGRIGTVKIASWPDGVSAWRVDLNHVPDTVFSIVLVDKGVSGSGKTLTYVIFSASDMGYLEHRELPDFQGRWNWLLDSLNIPRVIAVNRPNAFEEGKLEIDAEIVDLYRMLGSNLPFAWRNSELVVWVEQQLTEGE